jgi:hypothetical protein
LIAQPLYSEADKERMLEIVKKHKATGASGPFFLQETRRRLYSNGKIVAEGRDAWVGSIEWRRDLIQAPAIDNTGRIVNEIKADALCLIEVESRPVLRRFNETILTEAPYPRAMLIDGNDERGIDVGLLCRRPMADMRSHVDDLDPVTRWPVFSRDCVEFEIDIPGTRQLWVLVNHFKGRGDGSKTANDAKRKRQSETVAPILKRFDLKKQWVVVAGDFNELPSSDSLAPLLKLACAIHWKNSLTMPIAGPMATMPCRARTIRSIICSSRKDSGRGCGRWELSVAAFRPARKRRVISSPPYGRQQLRERPPCGLGRFGFMISS